MSKLIISVNHEECYEVALPFLCQYLFPLHDCNTAITYTATSEDCTAISTGACAQLWSLAVAFGYKDRLPKCEDLPPRSICMYEIKIFKLFLLSIALRNSTLTSSNPSQLRNESITCREDFVETNSTCQPRCDKFEQTTHAGVLTMIYSELFASITGLLVVVLIMILSLKNYKTMSVREHF